jgi:hypothetical protein
MNWHSGTLYLLLLVVLGVAYLLSVCIYLVMYRRDPRVDSTKGVYRARCGLFTWLVVNETSVRIECKGLWGWGQRLDVLPRQHLAGVRLRNLLPPFLGWFSLTILLFAGPGRMNTILVGVPARPALKIMALLGYL